MQSTQTSAPDTDQQAPYGGCPVDHTAFSQQKTARVAEPTTLPIERDAAGVWHVRGFAQARAILRSSDTKQAGFKADLIERAPRQMNPPLLYQEGKAHQMQRKQTARFFTPRAVSANYRHLMETLADSSIADLQRMRRADLSQLSLALAVRVAAQVVGLTSSRLPGMDRRLNAFLDQPLIEFSWRPRALVNLLRTQLQVTAFFNLDVKPAIAAHKRLAHDDVIAHLLAQGASDTEILTECITYGAAGMITTREFISVAAWHFLEQPALRARFLVAPEDERHAMLEEILRLEPVVGHLYRRATADLHLQNDDAAVVIPEGALIDLHIYATNADESVVGECPLALRPGRELHGDRVPHALMGFGDGHHRCPGSYVAIQEADIFLQRLLALDGLRIERAPTVSWNDLIAGFALRDFIVALD